MGTLITMATRFVRDAQPEVSDLQPRVSPQAQALANRIKALGWDVVLEDQLAVLATYEWLLRTSPTISEETSRRYAHQIRRFLEGLGTWRLPDGTEGPITIFHLATPGVGLEILLARRLGLGDPDEVESAVFGDTYRVVDQAFREYVCRPGTIADYLSLSRLGHGVTRQTGTLLLADRYGPLMNPFLPFLRPWKKQRRHEPVPTFDEWLQVLDLLWTRLDGWLRTLPLRKAYPLIRAVNMLHLQSATGPRPGELCLVKQGHLLGDRLRILHGGEKDRFPRNRDYDLYGNRLGRFRETPLGYVPERLHTRLLDWLQFLAASDRIALDAERALFPNNVGREEDCVSYERYRCDLKRVLLDIADEPSVKHILDPYLVRRSPTADSRDLRLTPHTIRSIYATHRMDLCDTKPGAFRALMQEMGWLSAASVLTYDRPWRVDSTMIQDQFLKAVWTETP